MKTSKLFGVIPPVSTPLKADGRVHTAQLAAFTNHLISQGVHGLFANGSMSGFPFLPDEEQDCAIATVVEASAGRVPVMGGLGEIGTARAIARARSIASLGVSHISVLPPLFYFTDQQQIIRYVSEIAAAVDTPIVLYDNPVLTKNPIQPQTVAELRRRIPSVVGIKESNQDCNNLQTLLSLTRGDEHFSVLTGSETLILVGLQMGVDGMVGGMHNIAPSIAVELYNAFIKGDLELARARQQALAELMDLFFVTGIWDGFEDAMRFLGLAERVAGSPYQGIITLEQSRKVREIVSRHIQPFFRSLPPLSNEPDLQEAHPLLPIEA